MMYPLNDERLHESIVALENRSSIKYLLWLIQVCYKRPFVKTTCLVEWLNSLTRKASNDHRGFESQKLSLFLFVEGVEFRVVVVDVVLLLLFFSLSPTKVLCI